MEDPKQSRISSHKLNSSWGNPQILGILVAIIAVILTLIAFSLYRKSKGKRNGILLLGLCDAGKTLIFARLVYKKYVQTHTSGKENMEDYLAGNVSLKVIDIPGHERLRGRYFDQFKSLARGLVFVVDSLTIQKNIKDVAEYLYTCLIDGSIVSNTPPLLILCNKQGEATAKGSTVIKMLLEKEINILRNTKTRQLDSIGKTSDSIFLGKEGKDFEFSHLSPMKIDFAESSAIIGQDENAFQLNELEEWIHTLIFN